MDKGGPTQDATPNVQGAEATLSVKPQGKDCIAELGYFIITVFAIFK